MNATCFKWIKVSKGKFPLKYFIKKHSSDNKTLQMPTVDSICLLQKGRCLMKTNVAI